MTQNLFERFRATEDRCPGRLAVVVQGETHLEQFTYADLDRLAAATAAQLRSCGITRGDRCALLADNHARWCAAFLGILGLGAIAVPLDTTLRPAQIATLLRASGCRAIFTSRDYLPALRSTVESCPDLRHTLLLEDLAPASTAASLSACPARRDDLAAILYTSGTTNHPQGVALTHANLLAEIDTVLQVVDVNENDRILGVLPLFHALALLANFWLPFAVGACVVFLQSISSGEILRAMREREISIFCVVPQFFYLIHGRITHQLQAAAWLRRGLFRLLLAGNGFARTLRLNFGRLLFPRVHAIFGPRMRLLVTGGSRFDAAVARDFHRLGFTLLQAYGLTETSGAATVTPASDNRIGSVGRPLPGVEVKLLPAELPFAEAAGSGEIAIRGPIVMREYYQRPDATAAVLEDGWLRTGDLGYFDADRHLFITGRKKDVIVLSSGKNIYPEEIEAHYLQSPFIKELCVLGRASQPGEPLAERLHAVVVPNFEVLRERKLVNAREILRYEIESLSVQLPSHRRILSYELWPHDLPRTTTRKLKRFEIERALAGRPPQGEAQATAATRELAPEDRAWAAEPRVARALGLIAQATRPRIPKHRDGAGDIHPDANLELDLGLDSMQRVELLVTLEQEFGTQLDEEATHRIFTVRELVAALLAQPPSAGARAAGGLARPPGGPAWDTLLAAAPEDDPALSSILKPKRFLAGVLFAAVRILYGLARLLLPLRVEGRENLPRNLPYILSPNHQSYLDAFLLSSALPYESFRRLFFLGASEYFTSRAMRWVARTINLLPVDPDSNLVRAMQAGAFGLRHGKVLVLFPEGERSIDAEVKTFKKGAAILSTHLQVPIVPVALDGVYDVWPRGRVPQRLAPVRIRIGAPLPPPPPPTPQGTAEDLERSYARSTTALRNAVLEMFDAIRSSRSAPSSG